MARGIHIGVAGMGESDAAIDLQPIERGVGAIDLEARTLARPAGNGLAERRVAHVALDEHGDAVGHVQGHVARGLADDGARVLDQHGAGREHFAVAVGQRDGLAVVVERGDGRKRRPQIDADQLSRTHCRNPVSEDLLW